jgi:hypothetical protein
MQFERPRYLALPRGINAPFFDFSFIAKIFFREMINKK